ncbi:hypothetical protein AGMMS50229_21350 [Campylobacterota bacterium]|nr:hypothetical protein AGMMS50229_21350 [Campylobacterota bacterium]
MPLYEQIDFSRGVYDPVNQPVWISSKPSILRCPSDGGNYNGNLNPSYMACSGGTETPIDADNNGCFFLNSKLRSRDIPDGTSSTIWLGESLVLTDIRTPQYGAVKCLLPQYEDEGEEPDLSEEDHTASKGTYHPVVLEKLIPEVYGEGDYFGGTFVYGGLGWMSGTPGTIRNTGNPINILAGPFSSWPMPVSPNGALNTEHFPWSSEALKYEQQQYAAQQPSYRWSDTGGAMTEEKPAEWISGPTADPAKVWAKELPGQYKVGGYSSHHTGGANFLLGDGSTHFINSNIDLKVFQNLGNRADGELATVEL